MNGESALAIVKAAQSNGALVFANIENMEAKTDLYRTEVTEIAFKKEDFHDINGKAMPNKAATDRIGEAFGIQFIASMCRVTPETRDDPPCGKRTVFRGEAQGKVRMPDGSWRESAVDEYEFDPVLRAMLDYDVTELNAQTRLKQKISRDGKPYGSTLGKYILELQKIARQRAATGARLRVIRQLTGMSAAFEKADALKPMVFTRVVQNTSYILKTPEGRAMATAQALGVDVAALFGGRKALSVNESESAAPQRDETGYAEDEQVEEHAPEIIPTAAAPAAPPTIPPAAPPAPPADDWPGDDMETVTRELVDLLMKNEALLNKPSATGTVPYAVAKLNLEDSHATLESRRVMLKNIRAYLDAKKRAGVAA